MDLEAGIDLIGVGEFDSHATPAALTHPTHTHGRLTAGGSAQTAMATG